MRTLAVPLCLGFCLLLSATHSTADAAAGLDGTWLTDFNAAHALAKKHKKPLLVDFTGSDWCGWCIRLDKEVFDKSEFAKWAKDDVVLLKLDFPRKKKQSKKEKELNQKLATKYGVRGFPTVLVLDGKGEVIKKFGYKEGGPKAWTTGLATGVPALANLLKKAESL